MKVTTNVTVDYADDKGRRNLAPGVHNLDEAIAKDLIERGFAHVGGKAPVEVTQEAGSAPPPPPPTFDTSLLERTIPDIEAELQKGELTQDQLKALKKAEKAGTARAGVFSALDKAFAALAAK